MKYNCDIKKEEYAMLEEWKYYNDVFKSSEQRDICDNINNELLIWNIQKTMISTRD